MQVEQIDIDAVNAFQARSFESLFRSTGPAKRPINEAHRLLAEAFARHRRQARAEQAAELAKFKALAETLAGALEAIRSEAQREEGSWLHLKRCIAAQSAKPCANTRKPAMLADLRNWLWDNFGWELIDWADDDIRF